VSEYSQQNHQRYARGVSLSGRSPTAHARAFLTKLTHVNRSPINSLC
jgi:hypothetical protein